MATMQRRLFSTTPHLRSYIGSQPIPIPSSITLSAPPPSVHPLPPFSHLQKASTLLISGPLGSLPVVIPPYVRFAWSARGEGQKYAPKDPRLCIAVVDPEDKAQKQMWGTTRSLIHNAVVGTTRGYYIVIKLVGVGYRVAMEDDPLREGVKRLRFKLGFSHDVLVDIPSDLRVTLQGTTAIEVAGIDKQRVGEWCRYVQKWRKPEPYKGKGIFIGDETIKRKTPNKKK
ncbi:ribosomal protein L6 [Atractiella rhizophila]|nr:ribosomal protein L6 [Atractiella rhizophila]